MVIYEVYLHGNGEIGELIGVLPERRVNRDRIDSDCDEMVEDAIW